LSRDIVFLLFSVVVLGVFISSQIFLSKRKNKWLGLILPSICLLYSIFIMITNAQVIFSALNMPEKTEITDENGEITEIQIFGSEDATAQILPVSIFIFVIYNIPTVILFVIYRKTRGKITLGY